MMGLGAIPWTAINDYGYRHEFFGIDFEKLVHFVEVLDGVFLSHQSEKSKKKKPPMGGERPK